MHTFSLKILNKIELKTNAETSQVLTKNEAEARIYRVFNEPRLRFPNKSDLVSDFMHTSLLKILNKSEFTSLVQKRSSISTLLGFQRTEIEIS